MRPLLSIVIPCFNEGENVVKISGWAGTLCKADPLLEILLVDNGSNDNSFCALESMKGGSSNGFRVIKLEANQGYGGGIKAGLSKARGTFVGWIHADLQTPPTDVLRAAKLLRSLDSEAFIKGERVGRALPDKLFSTGMSIFETLLFRTRLLEINAQPSIFPRSLLTELLEGPSDFAFDLFALIAAKRAGLNEVRIKVLFLKRESGVSKWNNGLSAKIRFVNRTLRFSLRLAKAQK